ncbi:MAG: hypothetical protein ABEK36_02470 [Candidatus Aenigmatarchaeota archaeon]
MMRKLKAIKVILFLLLVIVFLAAFLFFGKSYWKRGIWLMTGIVVAEEPESSPSSTAVPPPGEYSVTIDFDPQYIIETEQNRNFTPEKPISPFDDIVCELRVSGVDEKPANDFIAHMGHSVTDNVIYPSLSGKVNYVESLGDTHIYQWKVDGWPGGITSDEGEILMLIREGKIKCEVEVMGAKFYSLPEDVTPYVQLWGNEEEAEYKFVTFRTLELDKSSKWLVDRAYKDVTKGFHKVDPFKYYKNKFVHYAFIDPSEELRGERDFSLSTRYDNLSFHAAYTYGKGNSPFGLNRIYVDPSKTSHSLMFWTWGYPPLVVVHEAGHAFCGLFDEYTYLPSTMAMDKFSKKTLNNCFPFDKDEEFPFLTLKNLGPYGKPWKGCTADSFFRTSDKSIMHSFSYSGGNLKFNVWSCASCRKEILRNERDMKNYTEEDFLADLDFCKTQLDTIYDSPSQEDFDWECGGDEDCQMPETCNDSHKCTL